MSAFDPKRTFKDRPPEFSTVAAEVGRESRQGKLMLGYTDWPNGTVTPHVVGEFAKDDWIKFKDSGASVLALNSALGWNGSPGFLREISDFGGRGLHILSVEHRFDVSVLDHIGSISYVYLGLGCRGRFDAASHASLTELRVFAEPRAIQLELAGSAIEVLFCRGSDIRDLTVLERMEHLTALRISKPGFLPESLPEGLPIRSAEFYAWSKLHDLARLSSFPLTSLRLTSCKRISDYGALAALKGLKTLFLDECAPLPSAKLLSGLHSLSDIELCGTEFIDKNISTLGALPLKRVKLSGKGYFPQPESLAGIVPVAGH